MNKKRCVFLIIFIFSCISIKSQDKKKQILHLIDCIEIASDCSLQAFIAQNYYKSSYWEYRSYKAARLPSISLKMTPVSYNRNIVKRYNFQENIDIYRTQQSLYTSGTMTLIQNLDITGGVFFADSELGFIKNYGDNNKQLNSIPIRIGYSQTLFGFNSFKWERKIEPLKFEKAKKQFLYRQQEIAENTVQYFFSYVQAEKEYELALENLFSADTLYTIGLERQKISAISEADVLTLKLNRIIAQNTIKNAELNLKDVKFAFMTFLNLDKNKEYSLNVPDKIDDIPIISDQALMYAQNNNPEYLTYQQETLEAEREVERTRKASFEASVSASIGYNQIANTFAGVYRKPLQQDIFTISLTIPILDWGVKPGRINIAKGNLEITKLSIQQKKQSLEQELVSAIDYFNNQKELITSAQEILLLANEAYQINKKRFVVGKVDISTLTLSLNRYEEAQRNYLNILKYYWSCYFKIRKITLYDFEKQKEISILFDNIINKL